MTDHPAPQPSEIANLIHDHGHQWQIVHDTGLDVWTAVHRSRDGRHIRMHVAYDPATLAAKLDAAQDRTDHPVWVKVCGHPGCVITTGHTHGTPS